MKYELINPSDEIYFDGDFDLPAMGAAVALIGDGQYALRDSNGVIVVPLMMFGGCEEWFTENRTTIAEVLAKKPLLVAEFLESLSYAHERSSLNNIGERARIAAKGLRKNAEERV